jgi:hypothetical protein
MPTLLKMKPSNIVNVRKQFARDKGRLIAIIESEIRPFYSRVSIIYENEDMIILLIYNQELLIKVLNSCENKRYLNSLGYLLFETTLVSVIENKVEDIIDDTIDRLKQRYYDYKSKMIGFPHEVGIILGYPLQDVEGFVLNNGRNYLLCGYWKVYHDADNAMRTFENYYRIRKNAIKVLEEGKNLNDIMRLDDSTESYII